MNRFGFCVWVDRERQRLLEILHEFSKGTMRFKRVTQRSVEIDFIVVPTSLACFDDDAACLQFAKDPKDSALCDADFDGEFAHSDVWLTQERDDGMSVVGEVSPANRRFRIRTSPEAYTFRLGL